MSDMPENKPDLDDLEKKEFAAAMRPLFQANAKGQTDPHVIPLTEREVRFKEKLKQLLDKEERGSGPEVPPKRTNGPGRS